MNLEKYLCKIIKEESDKLILRHHAYHNGLHHEYVRNTKRLSTPPKKTIKTPNYWKEDRKFNPFYVKKKSKSIARSIANKIADKTYKPYSPYIKNIPKAGGGSRAVAIYQIPDAAVSKIYYNRLLAKNKHRFSSFSYAYRNDRNVHFAIQDIWLDISRNARLFIAEFDFSDFFGSISHTYLKDQYKRNGFYISAEERFVINAFLENGEVGIPQGTSISLFLANLVCWQLDLSLERAGLKFARYADDTVIWSPDYQKICDVFTIINEFSLSSGISINAKKSDGISLLTQEDFSAEIKNTKTNVEFLGYSISMHSVSIKDASIKKIQKQISYLLYRNLIQPLSGTELKGLIIPANDKDPALLTAIMQIRRYMYGGLNGQQLRNYINGRTKRVYFKGIMSFYPLVNDQKQLRALDGWLVSVICRAIKLRHKLLKKWGYDCSHIFPFNIHCTDIPMSFKHNKVHGKSLLEIPSFMLIQRALEKGLENRGIESVMNPESMDYDY
ncbi:reverse transcriptase domain-containing protein [Candidatus Spongiihabitans sp.]|uniref:reverse transcriptase domain-containing protein n=1 Tax=Candidatus Spongiihabitans sp. TaxID=3101308 RepID=UPI003C7B0539